MFQNLLPAAHADSGYRIKRSLRLFGTRYLSRTPVTNGNQQIFTISAWVKRSQLGSYQTICSSTYGDGSNGKYSFLRFDLADTITFGSGIYGTGASVSSSFALTTAAAFRDPSAWYHIVATVNTTAASNRVQLWVNGFLIATSNTTNLGDLTFFNINTTPMWWGAFGSSTVIGQTNDGYLADCHFIDGQQLAASAFGKFDPATGAWVPIAYAGTYGVNGHHLDFSDNSAATAAAIGKDSSGNGNNFTPTNLSVAAGVGTNVVVDSPTSYGTTSNLGESVRGNYCTLNPVNSNVGGAGSVAAVSNGGLTAAGTSSANRWANGTMLLTGGKWRFEATVSSYTSGVAFYVGFRNAKTGIGSVYQANGTVYKHAVSLGTVAPTLATGNVVDAYIDIDAGTIDFYKDGGLAYSMTGVDTTDGMLADVGLFGVDVLDLNFGQRAFLRPGQAGYKECCATNLVNPIIAKPSQYFDTKTHTGTGAVQSVTTEFQPDMLWIKSRNTAGADHVLEDAMRGVGQILRPNLQTAETTHSSPFDGVTSINSNGFSMGANTGANTGHVNVSGSTYVDWLWKKGALSGVDIVTFAKIASTNESFSHGLGATPEFMVVRARNAPSATGWVAWHSALLASEYLQLETTGAKSTAATIWNSTLPNSSVFTMGTAFGGYNFVGYLFRSVPGFSKFGKYAGNGSADGPFVYCDFRPRYLLVKRIDALEDWIIWDVTRGANGIDNALFANLNGAESVAASRVDLLSNGFKVRTTSSGNASGGTYIYAAFAETPFKYARAR